MCVWQNSFIILRKRIRNLDGSDEHEDDIRYGVGKPTPSIETPQGATLTAGKLPDVIGDNSGKATQRVVTPNVSTSAKYVVYSIRTPRDNFEHNAGKPMPSVAALFVAMLPQEALFGATGHKISSEMTLDNRRLLRCNIYRTRAFECHWKRR